MVTTSGPFLPTVQVLRAIAALMVLLYHVESGITAWFAPSGPLPAFGIGASGVDLFFLISGFIMVLTSRRLSARAFMARRLIRIVPLYWLSTLVFLAAALVLPQREGQDHSLGALLTSLLFIPHARPDGTVQPLNPVGWTLNYEMLFYVVFALALHVARERLASAVALVLGAAVFLGAAFRPEATVLRFWSDPIILEFLAGMALGRLYLSGLRLRALPAGALALAGIAAYLLAARMPEPQEWSRVALWGGPALLLLAAAALGPAPKVPPLVLLLGDASYSLYLLHLPVLLVFKQVGGRLPLPWQMPATPWLAAGLVVAVSVAVAVLCYVAFEHPLTRRLRRRLDASARKGPAPAQALRDA